MPARLSSLLVRDGLVGVKRMEKAFQRQVIYGGSLDTILLEMGLVPEDRLVQYLALASGLPPAARDDGSDIDGEALFQITSEIAAQFRAVPLSLDGEALRVLVCSPLEISELEDLADLLDRPLQPLITTEYRWHVVYARAYKVDAPARFLTLARQLEVESPIAPVGRARSVIIEDPNATQPLVAPPILPKPSDGVIRAAAPTQDTTDKIVFEPPLEMPAVDLRGRTSTLIGLQPGRAPTETGLSAQPPRLPAATPVPGSTPTADAAPAQGSQPTPANARTTQPGAGPALHPVPARTSQPGAEDSGVPVHVPSAVTPSSGVPKPVERRNARPVMKPATSEPIATAGRDSPLAVVRARELLATADDRDTVFLTLLRAARARARYAALLTVQGGAAIGRVALAETGIDIAAVQKVLIPLDVVSPFRAVVQNQQPHIGPLNSGDTGIDAMVMRLGGSLPPSAMLMPIVLRDRVVAIVLAHRVHSDLKLVDVTELLPLASGAADALGRLIVKHKTAGYRAPAAGSQPPQVEIDDDRIETKKIVRKAAEWTAPSPRASLPVVDAQDMPVEEAPPQRLVSALLDEIEAAKEGEASDALNEAVDRAEEVIGELAKRFPGKLHINRFSVAGRPLRASQYGGLLELTVRLGAAAGDLLVEHLNSPQRDIRFYATVCSVELRPRNAVFVLVERLFDQDFGVRELAVEALAGYPVADLTQALARARRSIHSEDPEIVAAAATALVQLGDVEAVSDLIGALERGDRGAEHVRRALVALTAQDFGLSERKWRKWFDGARRHHRIEWLIDGLSHKEDAIRELSINDLRRLTGEYFGYHHDLPRKEREVCAERWSSWWRETGIRRFVLREDERHRPTAVLPIRRET